VSSIFNIVSYFKEANKKLILALGREKLLKDLEIKAAYTDCTD
jgi:hypothetical protein